MTTFLIGLALGAVCGFFGAVYYLMRKNAAKSGVTLKAP